ncbi:discoidin domain-containing protein [bacterium]|nr:discoidin domain-containing protein [bacterium]
MGRNFSFSISPIIFLLFLFTVSLSFSQWEVRKKEYTVQIGEDGMLRSLKIHNLELLRSPLEFCPGIHWTAQLKENNAESIIFNLQSEQGTGEIRYRFRDNQLRISLIHRLGGFQTFLLHFSDDVLAFENLQNNTVKGAEAIQYLQRGEIRPLPSPPLSRVQRARLHLRNGAQVLFWHSGWGAPFNLDEIGSINGYTYRRNLLENEKQMDIYFQIEKPPANPLLPAPAFIPYGETAHNLFYIGEQIRFRIKFTPETIERLNQAEVWQLAWLVKDFWDKEVAKGNIRFKKASALKDKTVSISFPLNKRGWFSIRFVLTPAEPINLPILPSEFTTRFAIVRDDKAFPRRVDFSEQYSMSDYYYSALLGLKCVRESHNMSDFFPEKGKFRWEDLDRIIENADRESKRWNVHWFFQANSRPRWCSEKDYEDIAYLLVSRYKDKCKVWEVENEPNFSYSPEEYIKLALIPFSKGAKRADPSCHIIAPACVSVHHTLRFLEAMESADALKYLDGISTHTYVGPGEPWELFGNPHYIRMMQKMAQDKPIWQSEQGYWWDNVSKQKFARYVVRQFLNALAVGIPPERHFYYYVVHRGFEPMYLVEMGSSEGQNGTLEPGGVAVRIMNEEIGNAKPQSLEEPFFGVYALRFSGEEEDIVALWTLDFSLKLIIRGDIISAEDIMGNKKKLMKKGKDFLLDLDGYPTYVKLKKGGKFEIVSPRVETNWAEISKGARATASSYDEKHPPQNAIDGKWFTLYPTPAGQEEWIGTFWQAGEEGASEGKPVWFMVELAQTRAVNGLMLLTPLPAITAVPRDFQVQLSQDGKNWRTVAKVKEGEEWAYYFSFSPIKAKFIRVLITRLNDGWHLDGQWMPIVSEDFHRYTNLKASILELLAFGY